MSRPGKILLGFVGAVIVLVIIAIIVVFLTLDRGLKYAVEHYGPAVTGTPVNLNQVDVAPFSGEAELHGLKIGNPPGFESDYAFKLNGIKVSLVPEFLTSDTIVVREILVGGASLNAEFDGTKSNLRQILANLKKASGAAMQGEQPAAEAEPGKPKKLIIKEFRFTGGEVTVLSEIGNVKRTVRIPEFVLHDIGHQSGGIPIAEVAEQLLRPVIEKALQSAKAEVLQQGVEKIQQKAEQELQETIEGLNP